MTVAIPAGLPYRYLELYFGLEIDDATTQANSLDVVSLSPNRIDAETPMCISGSGAGAISQCDHAGTILVSNNGASFNVTLVNERADANASGVVFSFQVYGIY